MLLAASWFCSTVSGLAAPLLVLLTQTAPAKAAQWCLHTKDTNEGDKYGVSLGSEELAHHESPRGVVQGAHPQHSGAALRAAAAHGLPSSFLSSRHYSTPPAAAGGAGMLLRATGSWA